ncbi:DUF862-domain-containing protein [Panus rudis PR-1116 ss-1]|nr:DUF862-domain-containing protein [Panus rudis PR-1116 ss-1]
MPTPVQLYVYDLSNGLAKQLSLQLTGKQIDGVWHTSVVVYGKEIFYGQGISITAPGQSHHGRPLHVIDMGETDIDEETFQEYLNEMREHYTADKYHLLDFNCNSFTNDVIGFLTGGSIPSWIKDLPSDFLSTPFGAALRPTIDNMYRRPVPGAPTPGTIQPTAQAAQAAAAASPNPALAASLLQAVAAQAAAGPSSVPQGNGSLYGTPTLNGMQPTNTVAAPVHICTNPSSFHNILKTHRAVVAFFTSATCGPCRMIEPVFERLAHEKTEGGEAGGGVAFVKIDLGAGMGGMVGSEYGVRVTPTFIFFLDGKKTSEFKGADQAELNSQVNLLLYEAFPPHPHIKLSMPAVDKLSTNPILFTQVPPLDTVQSKLVAAIESSPNLSSTKVIITDEFVPYLKKRFPATPSSLPPNAPRPTVTSQSFAKWADATKTLVTSLTPAQLFPLVDLWRLAVLDDTIATLCASSTTPDPIQTILLKSLSTLDNSEAQSFARNYILTSLRLLCNAYAHDTLSRQLKRSTVTALLVNTLLHPDASVRTAAASLAFNISASIQKTRVTQVRARNGSVAGLEEDGEWEVELLSAVLEAIRNENSSKDVVHRLVASLAFSLRLSPVYESSLAPFLEVLQAKETLLGKLKKGGFGEDGIHDKDLVALIQQTVDNLC